MQVDVAVNGASLFAPFSFQRGLQHRGVPPCPAGRVPPGQLRNSSAVHSGRLLYPASKVGLSLFKFSFLFASSIPGTVSQACSLFSLGKHNPCLFLWKNRWTVTVTCYVHVSLHIKARYHQGKPLILRVESLPESSWRASQ